MKLPFAFVFMATAAFAAEDFRITVEAGDYDRHDTVVEFKLPPDAKPTAVIVSEGSRPTGLQITPDGHAWFIEPDLKRGAKRIYTFRDGVARTPVRALPEKGALTLSVFGRTALVYRTDKTEFPPNRPDLTAIYHRGGYIHPVLSPSGKQITDDYPSNHKHHHGIWWAWTHTEFEGRKPDFWNMGDGKGTVEFVSLDKTWSGPVHAGFVSKLRQVDLLAPEPKTALNETWNVKLYAIGNEATQPYFVFDVEVTDTCATDSPLRLPEYRYGGIGFRGNWNWNGQTNLNFLTSEGDTDRSKGDKNETRGRWAHISGIIDGGLTGIAILGHPQNFRAPQPMRIHPTEPFFNFAAQQAGAAEITPGKPFVARYRFVVADGAPDKAQLDRLWNDYAHPPEVNVKSQ